MANRPSNVTVRADLTQYAFGVLQDATAAKALIQSLCPVVPTGGSNGSYNTFDSTAAFKAYAAAVARRSVGGHAQEIGLLNDTANYAAMPNGLRIKLDEHEKTQAAGNITLVEQAKVRTLTIQSVVSFLSNAVTVIKASVSAASGKGTWGSANVDPIEEINGQIKAVYLASGIVPNKVIMDFGAFCVLASNPNVLKRMPGADLAAVNPMRIKGLLVNPNAEVIVVETAALATYGLGNSSATMTSVAGGSVLICYNSPMATPYDPSFCKTFAPAANLFTEVYSYREEPHFDWFEMDWTSETVVVASALCKRIDVTGANT